MSKKQLIFDLAVNGVLPWAGYVFLQSQYGWSDYHALLAVTVIPGFFALVGIVRKGRPDLIATVSLVTILLSLVLAAASDDTRVLQIRESYITLIMGIVFVISSMMKKPILWLLAVHQAKSEEHKEALNHPDRKKMLGTVNAVWGWSFVLEFAAKLWMIENLPISPGPGTESRHVLWGHGSDISMDSVVVAQESESTEYDTYALVWAGLLASSTRASRYA